VVNRIPDIYKAPSSLPSIYPPVEAEKNETLSPPWMESVYIIMNSWKKKIFLSDVKITAQKDPFLLIRYIPE
jgi:hypothetical protein